MPYLHCNRQNELVVGQTFATYLKTYLSKGSSFKLPSIELAVGNQDYIVKLAMILE